MFVLRTVGCGDGAIENSGALGDFRSRQQLPVAHATQCPVPFPEPFTSQIDTIQREGALHSGIGLNLCHLGRRGGRRLGRCHDRPPQLIVRQIAVEVRLPGDPGVKRIGILDAPPCPIGASQPVNPGRLFGKFGRHLFNRRTHRSPVLSPQGRAHFPLRHFIGKWRIVAFAIPLHRFVHVSLCRLPADLTPRPGNFTGL